MVGSLLASGSRDNTVRIWDTSDWTEVRILTGHTSVVMSVAFSPDGSRLASGSWDHTVRIWDTSDWTEVQTLTGHTGSVWSVAFSPDGSRLASGSWDHTVRIWDTSDWTEIQTLKGHNAEVWSVAFSPDGLLLASGSRDNTVRIWDISDGTEVQTLKGYGTVRSVAFSPDGTQLASGSYDKTVRIWDTSDWTEVRTLTGHSSSVFSPDGSLLAARSGIAKSSLVRIWDTSDWTEVRTLGHNAEVTSIAFSPDGTQLASGSYDKTVRIWDISDGTEVQTLTGHTDWVRSVAFSPITSLGISEAEGMVEGTLRAMQQAKTDFEAGGIDAAEEQLLSTQGDLERVLGEESLAGEEVSTVARSLMAGVSESLAACEALRSEGEIAASLDGLEGRIAEVENQIQASPFDAQRSARELLNSLDAQLERAMADGHQHLVDRCGELQQVLDTMIQRAKTVLSGETPRIAPPKPAVSAPALAVAVAATEPEQGGSDLHHRFTKGPLIAEGGMAQVFRATEKETGETVVWKQAHGRHNPLAVANQKLLDEAELLQVARHSRIPSYISHGEIVHQGERTEVLVLEFIAGGDLKNTVEQIAKTGLRLPLKKAMEYLSSICEPLEHMANLAEPVYHRDLKPHNIIVHPERGPVLIDFGLAKMVASGEDISVTTGGSGTWTPPERNSGITGPFTDVYSLGKILHYLLTNQKPPDILDAAKVAVITAAGHPQWLADLALRAAWPQHDQRIQTVEQFRILLNNEGQWPKDQPSEADSSDASGADDYTTWG